MDHTLAPTDSLCHSLAHSGPLWLTLPFSGSLLLSKIAFNPPIVQSVTSRLETSRYQDFSQFFERVSVSFSKIFGLKKSLGIGLVNIWSQKKSRYRSRKFWSKKSLSNDLKKFGLKKVSVTTSKNLFLKKSWYWSQKRWAW